MRAPSGTLFGALLAVLDRRGLFVSVDAVDKLEELVDVVAGDPRNDHRESFPRTAHNKRASDAPKGAHP